MSVALPAIALINGLVQLAPSLTKIFKGSETSVEVAEMAAKIARTVTGEDTNESALEELKKNPDLLVDYQKALLQHEREFEALAIEDKKSARERDAEFIRSGTRNYRADALVGVCVLVILIILGIVTLAQDLNEYAKGALTTILGVFLNQLTNVFNFEFGTTRKSDESDKKILSDYISIPSIGTRK